jgi:hypothetical protein
VVDLWCDGARRNSAESSCLGLDIRKGAYNIFRLVALVFCKWVCSQTLMPSLSHATHLWASHPRADITRV